jgi:serine/threonine protein kinase
MLAGGVSGDADDKTEELSAAQHPRRLGRYRLDKRIGSGGMADIFLARADGPGGFEKQVVIKRILPTLAGDVHFREMFLREARLLAALDHPNIVRIIELDEDSGEYFLALEYLEGLTLRELVERFWQEGRPVPIEPLMRVFADAALGLKHAHNFKDLRGASARLVHRDVSPDNIFLTTAGVTKVLDFGIAKHERDSLTQAGELKGKIPFMSPEQLQGAELDGRTDLFSIGVTFFWLLAGRRPFDGASEVHTMKAILEDAPPPLRALNPRIPQELERVVMACLEKDPARRLQSAAALHDALMTLLVSLPRGWPAPDVVVGQAMALRPTDQEHPAPRPAAVNVVPWPTRTSAVPLDDFTDVAEADTRAHRRAPPLDAVPQRAAEELDPSTEVLSTGVDEQSEGSFLVHSDPVLIPDSGSGARVKIEALSTLDPSAPTLQRVPAELSPVIAEARAVATPAPRRRSTLAPVLGALVVATAAAAAVYQRDALFGGSGRVAVDVDAGPAVEPTVIDAGGAPAAASLHVELRAPARVVWSAPSGEVLGKGDVEVELPADMQEIVAVDGVRRTTTRIPLRTGRIVYDELPRGKLVVRSRPRGALVYFGSERVGRTPLTLATFAGTQEVRLEYKKKRKDLSVEIKPGKQTVLTHDFRM